MRRRLVWSLDARADIHNLVEFLAESDADFADKVIGEIHGVAEALAEYDTGRPGRMLGTREKSLQGRRLIISFRVERHGAEESVVILHVVHSARNWQKGRWPPAP
jgi:toxin ParE1/3/4